MWNVIFSSSGGFFLRLLLLISPSPISHNSLFGPCITGIWDVMSWPFHIFFLLSIFSSSAGLFGRFFSQLYFLTLWLYIIFANHFCCFKLSVALLFSGYFLSSFYFPTRICYCFLIAVFIVF